MTALHYESYRQILQELFSAHASRVLALLMMPPLWLIFCLPFLLLGLGGFFCLNAANRSKIFSAAMLPYWAAGFALWISEFHRRDIMHLIYGSPLLLVLLFVISGYYLKKLRLLKSLVLGLITGCLILFGSFNTLVALGARQEIVTRRGKLYGFKQDRALQFLIEHTKPRDYVFIYPYYPMYYFLADVKNPTRYSILLYHINTEAQFNEVIENLQHKPVKYVLWDTLVDGPRIKTWFPQYEHPPEEKLHLERFLEDHYEVIAVENGFRILRRREAKHTE
jgi:hypothetical protein